MSRRRRTTRLLTLTGSHLASDGIALSAPGTTARLALRGDTALGGYALAGPAAVLAYPIPDIGAADADGKLILAFGNGAWKLDTTLTGHLTRVDNATLTSLAGTGIRFGGHGRRARPFSTPNKERASSASRCSMRSTHDGCAR